MNPVTQKKLDRIVDRHEEVNALLSDPGAAADTDAFRKLSMEFAELEPVVEAFREYRRLQDEMEQTRMMLEDPDSAIRNLAREELPEISRRFELCAQALQTLLLPTDPNDSKNVFLEIRAGTGGNEAALFSGDLFRMYQAHADSRRWTVEVVSASEGEQGGYKEIISRLAGPNVYARLKFESGVHRVQRVPETESQGRIHTSTCTVAVMPEADEMDDIEISPADIRVDTFRASGAGGQHVNKTDSAIRITHLPTGIVVKCQDERSQHKNRARAMAVLKSRLLEDREQEQRREQASTRKSLVGWGDRSERIRTYNFAQGRVTDHRISLTVYRLDEILAGNVDCVVEPLIAEHQAGLLAGMAQQDS